MKWKLFFWTTFCTFTAVATIGTAAEMKDTSTGKTFPKTVTIEDQGKEITLEGTGVSTRKKFFVKVYSIASYIEDPSQVKGGDVFQNILNSKAAKQLTQVFVRNIDQKKVQDGMREALRKEDTTKEFGSEIEAFTGFFGAVKSNDTYVIQWLQSGTIKVLLNGTEQGTIENENFGKILWSIWFGKNSAVNRNQLVSELK